MKKILFILIVTLIGGFFFVSCDDDDDSTEPQEENTDNSTSNNNSNSGSNSNSNNNSNNNNSNSNSNSNSSSGETLVGDWKDGFITYYEQKSNINDYPWPLPEMESGYYNVAPAICFLPDFILGTAYEIKYGDKTIRVIAKDYCPDNGTTWFDNTPEAFEYLTGNKSLGRVDVQWRETPYYTNKNISVKIKSGSNNWFLGLYVFNGRYAVKKVELSKDGKQFYEMKPFDYNMFWELQCPFDQYNSDITVRLTDKYNHVVTGKMVMSGVQDGSVYDLGVNF